MRCKGLAARCCCLFENSLTPPGGVSQLIQRRLVGVGGMMPWKGLGWVLGGIRSCRLRLCTLAMQTRRLAHHCGYRSQNELQTACSALLCMSLVAQTMLCLCLVGPFAVCLRVRGLSVRVIFVRDFSTLAAA